ARARRHPSHARTIAHTEGEDLVAAAAADAADAGRTALPHGIGPRGARIGGAAGPSTGLAVLSGAEGPGVLVDLSEGRVVAEEVEGAAHDHGLDITVVAAGNVVRGLEADGQESWRHEDPETLEFITAGERLAYARR